MSGFEQECCYCQTIPKSWSVSLYKQLKTGLKVILILIVCSYSISLTSPLISLPFLQGYMRRAGSELDGISAYD